METFDVRLNGKLREAILFKAGDKVTNEYGDIGIVDSTENGGLFVNVDWDSDNTGRCWLATSLEKLS